MITHVPKTDGNADMTVLYRNYRGEVRVRRIRPVRWWFGKTELHEKPGWACTALDLERKNDVGEYVTRDFALTGFLANGQEQVEAYQAMARALEAAVAGG